jgi:hypothetical protein
MRAYFFDMVRFTAPAASRLHGKKPTATGFFTLAASRQSLIIGYARVSTTEQNLRLEHDDLKPALDASVVPTEARWRTRSSAGRVRCSATFK